jgi:hypothetical protein
VLEHRVTVVAAFPVEGVRGAGELDVLGLAEEEMKSTVRPEGWPAT